MTAATVPGTARRLRVDALLAAVHLPALRNALPFLDFTLATRMCTVLLRHFFLLVMLILRYYSARSMPVILMRDPGVILLLSLNFPYQNVPGR